MTTLEAALWTAPSAVGFIAGSMEIGRAHV